MLLRATLLGSTLRTIDPGTTCKPGRRRALAAPMSAHSLLDTGLERICFPVGEDFLHEGIVAPRSRLQWDGRVTGDKMGWEGIKLHSLGTTLG